jgi:hypothetical protein
MHFKIGVDFIERRSSAVDNDGDEEFVVATGSCVGCCIDCNCFVDIGLSEVFDLESDTAPKPEALASSTVCERFSRVPVLKRMKYVNKERE